MPHEVCQTSSWVQHAGTEVIYARVLTDTPAPVRTKIFSDLAMSATTSSTVLYSSSFSRFLSLHDPHKMNHL